MPTTHGLEQTTKHFTRLCLSRNHKTPWNALPHNYLSRSRWVLVLSTVIFRGYKSPQCPLRQTLHPKSGTPYSALRALKCHLNPIAEKDLRLWGFGSRSEPQIILMFCWSCDSRQVVPGAQRKNSNRRQVSQLLSKRFRVFNS